MYIHPRTYNYRAEVGHGKGPPCQRWTATGIRVSGEPKQHMQAHSDFIHVEVTTKDRRVMRRMDIGPRTEIIVWTVLRSSFRICVVMQDSKLRCTSNSRVPYYMDTHRKDSNSWKQPYSLIDNLLKNPKVPKCTNTYPVGLLY